MAWPAAEVGQLSAWVLAVLGKQEEEGELGWLDVLACHAPWISGMCSGLRRRGPGARWMGCAQARDMVDSRGDVLGAWLGFKASIEAWEDGVPVQGGGSQSQV